MSTSEPSITQTETKERDLKRDLLGPIGYILGVSYPVLALSAGARSIYQIFLKEDVAGYIGPLLSGFAALLYLVAAVGFFRRTPRWWRISVSALTIETIMTVAVGTLSFIIADVIGGTVWRHFGQDYGFFPLIQPLLGLSWLLWTPTRTRYGILPAENPGADETSVAGASS